jgi:hypothetical protein
MVRSWDQIDGAADMVEGRGSLTLTLTQSRQGAKKILWLINFALARLMG